MKKRKIANLVMVAMILVIVTAGVLTVGFIRGWFDRADGTQAVVQEVRGMVRLSRSGTSYQVDKGTVLRKGDRLECQNGATATLSVGEDQIVLGTNASVTVTEPGAEAFALTVQGGEVFVHCQKGMTLSFDGKTLSLADVTALVSVRSGAQSVSVLRGTVDGAQAGQLLQYIGGEKTVGKLQLASLNDFAIGQIRGLEEQTLCFTTADLDRLAEERRLALEALINDQPAETLPPEVPEETPTTEPVQEETLPPETQLPPETTEPPTDTAPPRATEAPVETEPPETVPVETTREPETTAPAETQPPEKTSSCTITIVCDTILNNMDSLEPGKAEFVPADGVILVPVRVYFTEGETVFDVLKRVCDRTGIQLEYSWTPLYNSYYVEGIHNLYEFDCGFESGWMYKVNGWFPNYGCSSYTLKDGDVIVWCYTCQGLGTDVGAPRME